MKKIIITVAMAAMLCATTGLTSCIGSFALTRDVLEWNKQVGNKFINEVVFFAFWVLPVYEVCALADVLVINSIEFWSGSNPLAANSTQTIDTEHGRYLIARDQNGYDITNETTGDVVRLDFDTDSQTWSVITPAGETLPLMTMIDDTHVRMLAPGMPETDVELSHEGLMAWQASATGMMMAAR